MFNRKQHDTADIDVLNAAIQSILGNLNPESRERLSEETRDRLKIFFTEMARACKEQSIHSPSTFEGARAVLIQNAITKSKKIISPEKGHTECGVIGELTPLEAGWSMDSRMAHGEPVYGDQYVVDKPEVSRLEYTQHDLDTAIRLMGNDLDVQGRILSELEKINPELALLIGEKIAQRDY